MTLSGASAGPATSTATTSASPSTRELRDAWPEFERTGWLASIDAATRSLLFGIAKLKTYDAGEHLYRTGDAPNGVFGLVSGTLDILLPRLDGQEFLFHRATPGFWVGDLALFSEHARLVSVRSVTASRVVLLPARKLADLVETHPRLVGDFYRLTYQNVSMALRLLGNVAVSGADQRVGLRLLVQASILPAGQDCINVSRESLAEMIALSTQSVRRALRKLESCKLIECSYGRVRILDRAGLAAHCGYSLATDRNAP